MKREEGESPTHFAKAITHHQRLMSKQSSTYGNIGKTTTQVLPRSMIPTVWNATLATVSLAVMAVLSPVCFTGEAE